MSKPPIAGWNKQPTWLLSPKGATAVNQEATDNSKNSLGSGELHLDAHKVSGDIVGKGLHQAADDSTAKKSTRRR